MGIQMVYEQLGSYMEKYRDVINRVLMNKPIVFDENTNPNTERHMDQVMKIRKVNFKLQDDKTQLISELKGLRESYIKYKSLKESKDVENKNLKLELSRVKEKLERTENLNVKLEKRLYSGRKAMGSVKQKGDKLERLERPGKSETLERSERTERTERGEKNHSTKTSSNFSTELPIPKTVQYSISIQTQPVQQYEIGCQTDQNPDIIRKQKPKFVREQFQNLVQSINLSQSEKISAYETDKTSFRTSTDGGLTQRYTGRIVSARRKQA